MEPVFAARTTFYQPFTGQLNLALFVDAGTLTVHVIQGRHLWIDPTVEASRLKSSVKLSLMPDTMMRTFCKTEAVYGRDCPHFSERFTFDLQSSDYTKRLLISAWQFDGQQHHLLGCMSFGLRRLAKSNRVVSGWFYLLTTEVGKTKHLRAREDVANTSDLDDGLSALLRMDRHKLPVQRGYTGGFGFSIVGSCPVTVSRVDVDSDAATTGLQVEDILFHVNGENVLRSSSEGVARIIRLIGDVMLLDIYRPTSLSAEEVPRPLDVAPWRPRKRVHVMNCMRAPALPAALLFLAEPVTKRPRRKSEPLCFDNLAFQEDENDAFERAGRGGIIRNRDSVRKGNRVSFAETVMCQSILKMEDLATDSTDYFRD